MVWICYIGILTARICREYMKKRCLDKCHVNFSFKNKGKMGFRWHGLQKYAILLRNRPPGWHLQHFCFTWNIVLLHLQHLVFNIIKVNFNIIKICCICNSWGKLSLLWKTMWKMWKTFYKIISKKLLNKFKKNTWQAHFHMIYYSYSQTRH